MVIHKAPLIILIALLILTSASTLYLYRQTRTLTQDPNAVAQQQTADVVAAVGKLIVLPEGETPTVATVSDPDKLKDQPFFAHAKTGDKVLVYTSAKMAYLYDPSINKVVEVAPLNIGTAPALEKKK